MKSHVLVFLIIISFPVFCTAQSNLAGCIKNEQNKSLPDASVMFYQNDSLVGGITTDKKGCFSLRMNNGKYQMQIFYLGYSDYTDSIQLPANGLTLPEIILKQTSVKLDEAVISGEKIYETQLNKTIFNVPARIKKSSSDVYQILSNVPMIAVDLFEKQIKQLVGADNFIVMVNNIRRDKGYLLALKPENVDKIEIIRNPGARYSSINVDGIINIVTKAPIRGQSGYIEGQLNPKFSFFDAGYTHVGEKLSVTLSGQDFFFNEKKRDISIVRDMIEENKAIHTEKQSNRLDYNMNNLYLSPIFDYTISSKAFLTLNTFYSNVPEKTNTPYVGSVFSDGKKVYDYTATNENSNKYEKYGANPYFQMNISKNRSLNMELDYNSLYTKDNSSYVELHDNGNSYANSQINRNRQKTLNAQINYQQKIKKLNFESGYRTYWQNTDFYNETNSVLNPFKYKELRNYLYINGLGEFWKKFSYQMGLGFDIVNRDLNSTIKNRYNELTPSAMLRYKIKNNQNVTIDYMKTRQSPSFSSLNPVPVFVDTSRIITGNPELLPYYINRLRLSYEIAKNKYYIWTSLQYRFVNNYISTIGNWNNDGTYYITYANAAHYSSTSFVLNFSVNLLKEWKIMANSSIEHKIYEDRNQPQLNKQFWTPSLWVMSMFNYKTFSVNFSYFPYFRTPTLTGYLKIGGESNLTANYNLNQSWSLMAGIRYLFPMTYKIETYTDGYSEIYDDNMTERYFRILVGARYNFQSGKQKGYKQKRSKSYDDNLDINTQVY